MNDQRWQIGAHEARVESPDVFLLSVVGDVSEVEAVRILELSEARTERMDHQFWLVDASRAGYISAGARRRAASWPLSPRHWGTAVFGVGFAQRMLASMLASARRALRGEVEPISLHATEPKARAWILAERVRRTVSARCLPPGVPARMIKR